MALTIEEMLENMPRKEWQGPMKRGTRRVWDTRARLYVFKAESNYEYHARIIAKYYGLELSGSYIKTGKVPGWDDGYQHDHFLMVLTRRIYKENDFPIKEYPPMEIRFHGSAFDAQTKEHRLPTMYDILAAITKYDPGTFENFCADFGYDTDSRRAEKTYHAVVGEWKDFSALFPEGIPEEIQEIA